MREVFRIGLETANGLAVLGDTLVTTTHRALVGLDLSGRERWQYPTDRLPRDLVACANRAVCKLYARNVPDTVLSVTADGALAWTYERAWGVLGPPSADRDEVVVTGRDFAADRNAWVFLTGGDGAVVSEVVAPANEPARFAGNWCVAQLDSGEGGIVRTDRRGGSPTVISTTSHVPLATSDELVVIDTCGYEEPSSLIAIELATGNERWRARGGRNMLLASDGGRVGYIEQNGDTHQPIVRDVTTGSELWRGAPVPPLTGEDDWYRCVLGPNALACYIDLREVWYFSLGAQAPIHQRRQDRDGISANRFVGSTLYEISHHGITAWELP